MSISNLLTFNVNTIYKQPTSTDTDNFQYIFNLPVEYLMGPDKVTHVSVTDIQLPKMWYQMQAGYNTFDLIENGVTIPMTLPIGNYNYYQLLTALQYALNFYTLNSITYTVLETNSPGQIGIAPFPQVGTYSIYSNNISVISSLNFLTNSYLDLMFGFPEGISTFDYSNGLYGVLNSGVVNLEPEDYIFLTSNCVHNEINDSGNGSGTLCTVYTGNIPYFGAIIQKYELRANMKPFNNVGQVFTFTINNALGLSSFFLNDINLSFTIHFFTYTSNNQHYKNVEELLSIICEK